MIPCGGICWVGSSEVNAAERSSGYTNRAVTEFDGSSIGADKEGGAVGLETVEYAGISGIVRV